MTQEEIEKMVANMSAEEKQALLDEDLGEEGAELEKEAAAEVAETDLIDALYAYGALSADMEIESSEGELSKEASETFAEAEAEISAAVEAAVKATGLEDLEDEVELHKKAQAAAAVIFQGYTDQIEKVAAAKGKGIGAFLKKKVKEGGKMLSKAKDSAKAKGGQVADHVKKNKNAYMAGAGGAALGAGAVAAKKHMDKKASELTADELTGLVMNRMDAADIVEEGLEKLSAKAGSIGKKMNKAFGAAKAHLGAHGKKYSAGAGAAAGAMGAHMAHRMGKKK